MVFVYIHTKGHTANERTVTRIHEWEGEKRVVAIIATIRAHTIACVVAYTYSTTFYKSHQWTVSQVSYLSVAFHFTLLFSVVSLVLCNSESTLIFRHAKLKNPNSFSIYFCLRRNTIDTMFKYRQHCTISTVFTFVEWNSIIPCAVCGSNLCVTVRETSTCECVEFQWKKCETKSQTV